jgi:hypothetical protein
MEKRRFPKGFCMRLKIRHQAVIFYLRPWEAGRKSPLTEAEEKRKRRTDGSEAAAKTTAR